LGHRFSHQCESHRRAHSLRGWVKGLKPQITNQAENKKAAQKAAFRYRLDGRGSSGDQRRLGLLPAGATPASPATAGPHKARRAMRSKRSTGGSLNRREIFRCVRNRGSGGCYGISLARKRANQK
jgi:hypothetical protein